jgi:hypothetical protein
MHSVEVLKQQRKREDEKSNIWMKMGEIFAELKKNHRFRLKGSY